jgi:hypothetical protein
LGLSWEEIARVKRWERKKEENKSPFFLWAIRVSDQRMMLMIDCGKLPQGTAEEGST